MLSQLSLYRSASFHHLNIICEHTTLIYHRWKNISLRSSKVILLFRLQHPNIITERSREVSKILKKQKPQASAPVRTIARTLDALHRSTRTLGARRTVTFSGQLLSKSLGLSHSLSHPLNLSVRLI